MNYIIDQASMLPYIKLERNVEEDACLLNSIEKVGQTYIAQQGHYQLEVLSEFYRSLNYLLLIIEKYNQTNHYFFDPRVKQCIEYLQTHYNKKVTLQELSQLIQISEAETIKLFKRFVGDTPFNYLQSYRLEQSAKQLMYMKYSVTQVAMTCGFSTTSYFIQIFKQKYQLTPKQFQIQYAKAFK
nr:AraC family transcriptional regulator [Staphylococcus sp. NRL 22/194]